MNKLAAFAILLMIIMALSSSKQTTTIRKDEAAVNQIQGYYIFIQAKPLCKYDYLGSVSKGLAWSGGPEEMLNSIVKKVKKEYPTAEGIVFTSSSMDKADAIKFKE